MNMTKMGLCIRVAEKLDKPSIIDVKILLETFFDEILNILAEGYSIEIRGIGCFKPIARKKTTGRNPRTGILVEIPEHVKPYFKFSKDARKTFARKLERIQRLSKLLRKEQQKS
jgi:nucleoid DNA-binding protein